jgi:orotidine-5'-phosphate decarboxylase
VHSELRYHGIVPTELAVSPCADASTESVAPSPEARDRLIVALDFPDAPTALAVVDRLAGVCRWLKVGMELYTAAGPELVRTLTARGFNIFLDLKFHDIPNTVAGAVRSAAATGARLVTIHAAGGSAMLAAAREALRGLDNPPKLLAVTVLTSMNAEQLRAAGIERSPAEQVEILARMALDAGINGFVCSPQEIARVRALAGPDAVIVTPGIRPAGAEIGDQSRIATPAEAIRLGASYLVVGRPITQAPDPAKAAEAILTEMA